MYEGMAWALQKKKFYTRRHWREGKEDLAGGNKVAMEGCKSKHFASPGMDVEPWSQLSTLMNPLSFHGACTLLP